MALSPTELAQRFPVRKSRQQKQAFRDAVQENARSLGYSCHVEQGSFHSRNIVVGDAEQASFLLTAHYDTCARMLVPNLITPCNFLGFVVYQIFLTALVVLPPIFLGALLRAVTGAEAFLWLGYLLIWGNLALMLFGPANRSNANDNTSGVVTLLEIARTMPENQRSKVCFVLFDLEEAGLIGSSSYRKAHRQATNRQLILNLDCVGDGDHLRMFPTKALKKDRRKLISLYKACGYFGKKNLLVQEKGFSIYPSDQMQFPYGVGICALHKSKFGLYLGRIHTSADTVLDQTNVNILRAALTTLICREEVN